GAQVVVSNPSLCECTLDKQAADKWFRSLDLPVPESNGWPLLAKPRYGASSRGLVKLQDAEEYDFWAARNSRDNYFVQRHIVGQEYSVDAFVARDGRCIGMVARQRIVVSGGEVSVSRTERHVQVLEIAQRLVAQPGWYGPLNIQIMSTAEGCYLLEV